MPARLQLLGPDLRSFAVTVEELSGAGARISSPELIPISIPLRLDWEDDMILGECIHSNPLPGGGYLAGIRFEHMLTGLADLRNLVRSVMAECGQAETSEPTGAQSHRGPKQR